MLKSKKSFLVSSGVFTGTVFSTLIGGYTGITILNLFIAAFLTVVLTMLIVRRFEVVKVSLVNWVLIGLTTLFILFFVPISQYIYLGYFIPYEFLFIVPLLLNTLLSFLCALILSLFVK